MHGKINMKWKENTRKFRMILSYYTQQSDSKVNKNKLCIWAINLVRGFVIKYLKLQRNRDRTHSGMKIKRKVEVRIEKIFLNLFFPFLAVLGTYKSKVKRAWKKIQNNF